MRLESRSNPPPPKVERADLEGSGGSRAPQTGNESAPISPSAEYFVRQGKAPPEVLESIIGEDERVRILDTHLMPWRMICQLQIQGSSGAAIGTGCLVGPHTVLTAGHCVHNAAIGGWAQRIIVTPGMNRDRADHGSVVACRFSTLDDWVASHAHFSPEQKADVDVGVIHLNDPENILDEKRKPMLKDGKVDASKAALGERIGWFGIAVRSDDDLSERYVHVAGYPGEPDKGFGREMWAHRSTVLTTTPLRVYYDVDTTPGQSGAPTFVIESNPQAPIVIAVHAYGTGGTAERLGVRANSAPRITRELFETIQYWIDNGPGESEGG